MSDPIDGRPMPAVADLDPMAPRSRRHRLRRALPLALVAVALAAGSVYALTRADPGAAYQHQLHSQSESLFGIGHPLENELKTTFTGPGDQAVEVADGLSVKLVSSNVATGADMIALWPTDDDPTYAFICNEEGGTTGVSVQRVTLATGEVKNLITGIPSCDPIHRTPWGTLIVASEAGTAGRLYEVFDPLAINADGSSPISVNAAAGTTSDPTHVIARKALGQLSYEGIVVLPNGTSYYGDELRPSTGKPGGGIYKFTPATPRTGTSAITSLAQSPLAAGTVSVLRLGSGSSYGQGANIGGGRWVALTTPADPTTFNLAATALAAGGYTGYWRPEDMDQDPLAAANGSVRVCWNNTGSDDISQWGETLCLTDDGSPVVSNLVLGNDHLRMPDNIDFQPGTGIAYILMDATTSNGTPTSRFSNDQVWACLPDGADDDVLSDGCVRVMNLKDNEAEFTGIEFLGDGTSFLIHLQHRTQDGRTTPGTTDEILVSGLKVH